MYQVSSSKDIGLLKNTLFSPKNGQLVFQCPAWDLAVRRLILTPRLHKTRLRKPSVSVESLTTNCNPHRRTGLLAFRVSVSDSCTPVCTYKESPAFYHFTIAGAETRFPCNYWVVLTETYKLFNDLFTASCFVKMLLGTTWSVNWFGSIKKEWSFSLAVNVLINELMNTSYYYINIQFMKYISACSDFRDDLLTNKKSLIVWWLKF